MQSKDAYRLYGLFPKNDNSSSSNVVRIASCCASFGPRIIVIWAELSVTWNANTDFLLFYNLDYLTQFEIDIYLLKARIHGIGKYSRLSLSAILNLLVCCETQHSNQNTHSYWLKREFRDITDVLIYRDIPDWYPDNSPPGQFTPDNSPAIFRQLAPNMKTPMLRRTNIFLCS